MKRESSRGAHFVGDLIKNLDMQIKLKIEHDISWEEGIIDEKEIIIYIKSN